MKRRPIHTSADHSPTEPAGRLSELIADSRVMLESLQANIFIADTDLNIVYMNPMARSSMQVIEPVLRSQFGISVDSVLGGSIHRFHRNPTRVESILQERGRLPHTATFDFGSVTLFTRISHLTEPARGVESVGRVLGYVVVWENHSELRRAAEQVNATAEALENSASAVAELAASVSETAHHASQASRVASEAVAAAQTAATGVTALGDSSAEIDKVVRTITAVAEQTKLLALNAAIEAARAGEAGKGFAVVAGEVKDLATSTGSAAGEISDRIRSVKTRIEEVVASIERIESIIGRIDEAQASIATVVEEQATVTSDLSRQIHDAAMQSRDAYRTMS